MTCPTGPSGWPDEPLFLQGIDQPRPQGVGQMPLLRDVLEKYPEKKFIIDHKDETVETAEILGEMLGALDKTQ